MRWTALWTLLSTAALAHAASINSGKAGDARLREVEYDPHAVITVPVQRGTVTLVQLAEDDAITEVAAGLGSDCAKPEAAWCIAAQPGGRTLFVKAKSLAGDSNNLAVVTDRRSYAFRFVVLAASDARAPTYRLTIKAAATRDQAAASDVASAAARLAPLAAPSSLEIVSGRLQATALVRNTRYSLAEGDHSADIVPSLVFDDGRFTYLRFSGNRDVPAVFQVLDDGSETVVNARMEGDLLVVDRVSRHLMLRAGSAVVGIWNDAFDLEGMPPSQGTTVPGVARVLRGEGTSEPTLGAFQRLAPTREAEHE